MSNGTAQDFEFAPDRKKLLAVVSLVKKGELRMVLRMFQDASRMEIAQHPSSPEDGFKDGNWTPKGWLRITQDFILDAVCIPSRMLQDGSRMAKDGPKDHPRIYPGCDECFWGCFGMARGCSRMVLRIILGIFPRYGVRELQDAPGWLEDVPGWS